MRCKAYNVIETSSVTGWRVPRIDRRARIWADRMSRLPKHSEHHLVGRIGWMRAAVLGANDGIISTASLVVGVALSGRDAERCLDRGCGGPQARAMSMAAGEYVSVSSQSDTEQADLARERKEQDENPEFELDELTAIYVERGVDQRLARQVAQQLMAKDALAAHARDELGMSEITTARPVQAALTSAAMFSTGAAMPSPYGRPIARLRAYSRCFRRVPGLPCASGSDRSKNRRRQHRARHSPSDILGRASHGYHCGHREALRNDCLKIRQIRATSSALRRYPKRLRRLCASVV